MTRTKSKASAPKGRRRIHWKPGDLFLVPLADGNSSLGQILLYEPEALNSVLCAFYEIRFLGREGVAPPKALPESNLVAVLFTTRDLLDNGQWKTIGNVEPAGLRRFPQIEKLRANGFIGARIIGSGIIVGLMNAFFGLFPWDDWADPEYLDKLLISPEKKPKHVVTRGSMEKSKLPELQS